MQTALITGVGKGIGKALAIKFLNEGYAVIGTSIGGILDYSNKNLRVFTLDLRLTESIAEAVSNTAKIGTKIDFVINNAGVLLDEEENAVIPEKLRQTLEVNLIGSADFTERILPFVKPGGHIIFISSTAGSIERTGQALNHWPNLYPAYKISKAAINMYMRTLALRLKAQNIVVSSVHPGWVKTEMGGEEAEIFPEESANWIYKIAVSRPETGQFWFQDKKLPW